MYYAKFPGIDRAFIFVWHIEFIQCIGNKDFRFGPYAFVPVCIIFGHIKRNATWFIRLAQPGFNELFISLFYRNDKVLPTFAKCPVVIFSGLSPAKGKEPVNMIQLMVD